MKNYHYYGIFFILFVVSFAQISTNFLTKSKSSNKLHTQKNTKSIDATIDSVATSSQTPSQTLYDCKDVANISTKPYHIKATCIKNDGTSYTDELNLDSCFGNGHGQLKSGINFSNSCHKDTVKILAKTVKIESTIEMVNFAFNKKHYLYEIDKDGPYYLNALCDKGKDGKDYGYSYINMYDVIEITDGVMGY